MESETDTCNRCKFGIFPAGEKIGQCRRYPQVFAGSDGWSYRPAYRIDWCGEWFRRPDHMAVPLAPVPDYPDKEEVLEMLRYEIYGIRQSHSDMSGIIVDEMAIERLSCLERAIQIILGEGG